MNKLNGIISKTAIIEVGPCDGGRGPRKRTRRAREARGSQELAWEGEVCSFIGRDRKSTRLNSSHAT